MRPLNVLLVLLLSASCAKGTPNNPILPPGVSPTPLPQAPFVGIGKYTSLLEFKAKTPFGGIPFITFIEVRQQPGSTLVHNDLDGIVYSVQGPHIIRRDDGDRPSVGALETGKAAWVTFDSEHQNRRGTEDVWYLISLRSIAQRRAQPPFPAYRQLLATPDLPTLPVDKPIVHQLGLITMDPGGRTSSHSHGGAEAFYVLKGTVELATNDGPRTNFSVGEASSIKPGVVMQLKVVGDVPVEILTYFATPEGASWQNNLITVP